MIDFAVNRLVQTASANIELLRRTESKLAAVEYQARIDECCNEIVRIIQAEAQQAGREVRKPWICY